MSEQPGTFDEIIGLLFESNEEPFFVDSEAPVEDVAGNPEEFISKASAKFGLTIEPEHLKMSIPELAQFVANKRLK